MQAALTEPIVQFRLPIKNKVNEGLRGQHEALVALPGIEPGFED